MSLAGTRLADHYTLIRPLGQGASSVVYLALGDDGQPYTVKLFHLGRTENAQREANMWVRSPHLAEVITLSEVNGQDAVVLRFSKGMELFQCYRQRPALVSEPAAYLRTLSDVLSALDAMHTAGWLHRDVKADNILVQKSGQARLLDYDLSGPIGETFAAPLRIGTAAFQSPEARRGEVLGPASDLYGVGTLLYWGLLGELPEVNQPQQACALNPKTLGLTAGPLTELCCTLLNPNPHDRPHDARAVQAELLGAAGLD